tara:strand:- start:1376 stop:1966 length:591 start_codon:yes stop_codon:yes gene_type:complete
MQRNKVLNKLKETGYIVIDDFINESYQNDIEMFLLNSEFQWYFYPTTSDNTDSLNLDNHYEGPQFVHIFFDYYLKENSPHLNKILNVLQGLYEKTNIGEIKLLRVKSNLQLMRSKNTEKNFTKPHKDIDEKHIVLLYYVNDNDGKTFLFNDDFSIKDTITPKKGRTLIFDGNLIHASSHPISYETRLVINYDLEIK